MKKYFLGALILLLAASCSKQQAQVQSNPVQSQPVVTSSSTTATTTPPTQTKPPVSTPPAAPITLNVYNDAAQHYKISYLNYFNFLTSADVKANNSKFGNISACVPYGEMPDVCFSLNTKPYQSTNLESAAVAVTVLKDKTNISDCATFTTQELQGGKTGKAIQINNVAFITATTSDAGAGNFSETHFNRAFYGTFCYEIDETARWAQAANFSPPKTEFDRTDIWAKLDLLRNGFQFVK